MGLLDAFQGLGNLSPDQTQGLLAAASQMLQQSGPSRTPTSFGQILGGGLGTYQQGTDAARRRKQDEEQAAQIAKLTGLKIQDAESDFANQAATRDRAEQLRQFYIKHGAGGGATQLGAIPTPAAMGNNLAPTAENSEIMKALQGAPQVASAPGGQNGGIYQQRLSLAQQLRNAGFSQEADAQETSALRFQPKVKEWQKVQDGGRVLYAPYFEDGTSGAPVPLEVAEKLQFQNTGGKTLGLNPFTGQQVAAFGNTQSPDSIASNATAIRGQNIGRQNALDALATPAYNQEAGGFITRPTAASPGGAFTPLAGAPARGPKMTEDQGKATGWLVQAENAFANMKAVGLDKAGNPTAAAKPGLNDAIGAIPGMGAVANKFRTADRQKFIQSSSSLSEALLRAATGAGVNKDEAVQKVQELTPIYGEDPTVTKQKFDAIPLYIDSLKVRAGPGAALAEKVLSNRPAASASGGWSIQRVGD